MDNKLKELKFPNQFVMTDILNNMRLQNVNKNYTDLVNFMGQLETGTETLIPYYQLVIELKTIYMKKKLLKALEKNVNNHISFQIQFNVENRKEYCEILILFYPNIRTKSISISKI